MTTTDVTQLVCPAAPKRLDDKPCPDGQFHHLIERVAGRGTMTVCTYCNRTPRQILWELAKANAEPMRGPQLARDDASDGR